MGGGRGLLQLLLLALVLSPLWAAPTVRKPFVLVLHSYNASRWSEGLNQGIGESLDSGSQVDLSIDYMDTRRTLHPGYIEAITRFYRVKYEGTRFDLILACDDDAYQFCLSYGSVLWGATPVVFCGVDGYEPEQLRGRSGVTGILEDSSIEGLLTSILQLQPGLRQLWVIRDSRRYSDIICAALEPFMSRHAPGVRVETIAMLNADAMAIRLAEKHPDTAVLYLGFSRDETGRMVAFEETLRLLQKSANPVYTTHEPLLGAAALGVSYLNAHEHGRAAGLLAKRVLSGLDPSSIPPQVGPPRRMAFDHSQLLRFGIPPEKLPPGAELRNEPFSFYKEYHDLVWGAAAVFIVLCFLLAVSVYSMLAQHRSARRLAEQERRLQSIFNQTYQKAWLLDTSGRVLLVNQTALNFSGLQESEVRGFLLWESLWCRQSSGEETRFREVVTRAAAGETVRFETLLRNRAGEMCTIDFSVKPVHDAGNRVIHLLAEGRDITQIRRVESHLRAVLDRVPLILWACDMEGLLILCTGSGLGSAGFPQDVSTGKRVFDLYRDDAVALQSLRSAFTGTSGQSLGRIGARIFETQFAPRLDPQGKICGAIGVALDVTDRAEAQAMQARLATAFDQSVEQIVLTDRRGGIQYVNPAFTRVTGYTAAEVQGKTLRILKSGEHDDRFYQTLWRTISSGMVWSGRFHNRRKDGSEFLEDATITPLFDVSGRIEGYVAVKRDITEQVALEESLRHAQRTETIGKLAGGVAHDFNNILQVIKSSVAFARDPRTPPSEIDEHLEQIEEASSRAIALTRQLLAFSRRQPLQLELLDPARVVENLLRLVRRLLGEHIRLEFTPPVSISRIRGDVGQIEQVLLNICVNARDAMPSGGTITIGLCERDLASSSLPKEQGLEPGTFVELSIADTGAGMDEETCARIFEPFYTTKPVGQGTGLGLSVVQGIVQQHGGFVQVRSTPGKGTTFLILLPARGGVPGESVANSVAAAPVSQPPAEPAVAGEGVILIADDDTCVRQVACRLLRRQGYQVVEASDGEEACHLAANHPGGIRLALLDVVMPRLGGMDAARRLRKTMPGLGIILCSGYGSEGPLAEGLDPSWGLVQKPYSAEELLARVREALTAAR